MSYHSHDLLQGRHSPAPLKGCHSVYSLHRGQNAELRRCKRTLRHTASTPCAPGSGQSPDFLSPVDYMDPSSDSRFISYHSHDESWGRHSPVSSKSCHSVEYFTTQGFHQSNTQEKGKEKWESKEGHWRYAQGRLKQ
jgi:hypothetical protein